LATITKLGKPLIDKIALLLKSPNAVIIEDLKSFFKASFTYGEIVFLCLFMKKIKIIKALSCVPIRSRLLLIGVILNRILLPRSKLGSISWVKNTAFPFLSGLDKTKLCVSRIYKAMDCLSRRLDKVLDNFWKENKGKTTLLLYDVTSVFFEGNGPTLAKYGHSRDEKPNNPQILLSLCLNEDKLLVYFDILEGNMQDKKTVIPFIQKVKEKFSCKNCIFVGDRGMVTVENLEFLEREGIDYIVALTHTEARELIYKSPIQLEIFDKELPVTIVEDLDGKVFKKYVLCGSSYRKERDKDMLERLLERGKKELESVRSMVERGIIRDEVKVIKRAQKKLVKSRCERFYDFTYKEGKFEIIEKREFIEKARALCGYYILKTTLVDKKEEEIEENYKQLRAVEATTFRELKELVKIMPIYHWRDRRVRIHVFLCILAQQVVNKIRDVLRREGWLSAEKNTNSCFSIFQSISLGVFKIERREKKIITPLTEEQERLLEIFGIEKEYFTRWELAKQEFYRLQ
jgi:transposase